MPNTSPLFIAELLDWINRVATEEGPRFIQDSGKDGVVALNPTIDNLRNVARGAVPNYNRNSGEGPTHCRVNYGGVQNPNIFPLPKGYITPRVQRAIRELADSLDEVLNLAYQIQGLQIPTE